MSVPELSLMLQCFSSSIPEQLVYMSLEPQPGTPSSLENFTREFVHVFDIYNRGPSTVESSELKIRVPRYTFDGKELVRFTKSEVFLCTL